MSTPGPNPSPPGDAPSSPRSPRPAPATPDAAVPTVPPGAALPVFMAPPGPPPRPNIGSMLFMTAFFFFMSGGNNAPISPIAVGPDGEIVQRLTELGMAGTYVDEYKGFLNGTGNWTEPLLPVVQPSSLIPPEYTHSSSQDFFTNVSGFYREARLHPVDLFSSHQSRLTTFFESVEVPNLNTTSWNETLATKLRGDFPWSSLASWDMNLKERLPEANVSTLSSYNSPSAHHSSLESHTNGSLVTDKGRIDWHWVKGVATLTSADDSAIDYNLYGLHYVPNGTYSMFGLPDGMRVDIRNIPKLWPNHLNVTRAIILEELEKELKVQQDSLYLTEVKADDETTTRCPLLVHLTVPPLPVGTSAELLEMYESEMHDPTGIRISLPHPPSYWEGTGLGGVLVADQCGWAYGLEGGKGVKIEEFWSRSINYAAFATVSQLFVLILLVRQMEATRTPSTLAKVSLWSIVIMGITDSWIFSAHVVVGIMSDNRTSLPMLVPGFLCLCSAIVFGPRYAVLLHRIQAPERTPSLPAPETPPLASPAEGTTITPIPEISRAPLGQRLASVFERHPKLQLLSGVIIVFVLFQFAFLPPLIPLFLFVIYSFWVPQIWRNARKGNGRALDHTFVLGTSVGRLALPLYAFSYEDNVFFIKSNKAVWGLVLWQILQIMMLLAQERFGPAFFLPKSFAPAETYNYHPLLPAPDAENAGFETKEDERTCSICMEEVDTRPGPSGEVLLGMNPRRGYALAPCHHLFHTKCLSQWLAIKTICPLCKRSLPPL